MNVALSKYNVFYATAKAGNISAAAKNLGISQPAVSKAIAKLEEEMGTKLFDRSSRGVLLTAAGDVLFSHVRDAFGEIERGREELEQIRDKDIGLIRMGGSATVSSYLLLPYLREFMIRYPHTRVTLDTRSSADTLRNVEDNKIDLGAVVLPGAKTTVSFYKITDVEDIFVCSPAYLRQFHEIEGEDADIFEKGTFMLLDSSNFTRQHIDKYFREHGLHPRHVLEMTTMDLLIEFAKIGLGVASVIREFVLRELRDGTLVQIPTRSVIRKRCAGFIYRENNENKALADFLRSIR